MRQCGTCNLVCTNDQIFCSECQQITISCPAGEAGYFGIYKLLEQLSSSKRALVYHGQHFWLKTEHVIKFLPLDCAKNSEADHDDFLRQARIGTSLKHPNIVKISNSGYASIIKGGQNFRTPYHEMEFIGGLSVQRFLQSGNRFSIEKDLPIFEGILDATAYMHNHGIVHRQINSSHILIRQASRNPVLIGSNSLKALNPEILQLTLQDKTAPFFENPLYMSPEQLDRAEIDYRTDIFSAGILIREMITGRPSADSQAEIPLPIRDVISTATAPDPARRYQSAAVLLDEFKRAANESGTYKHFINSATVLNTSSGSITKPEKTSLHASESKVLITPQTIKSVSKTPDGRQENQNLINFRNCLIVSSSVLGITCFIFFYWLLVVTLSSKYNSAKTSDPFQISILSDKLYFSSRKLQPISVLVSSQNTYSFLEPEVQTENLLILDLSRIKNDQVFLFAFDTMQQKNDFEKKFTSVQMANLVIKMIQQKDFANFHACHRFSGAGMTCQLSEAQPFINLIIDYKQGDFNYVP